MVGQHSRTSSHRAWEFHTDRVHLQFLTSSTKRTLDDFLDGSTALTCAVISCWNCKKKKKKETRRLHSTSRIATVTMDTEIGLSTRPPSKTSVVCLLVCCCFRKNNWPNIAKIYRTFLVEHHVWAQLVWVSRVSLQSLRVCEYAVQRQRSVPVQSKRDWGEMHAMHLGILWASQHALRR